MHGGKDTRGEQDGTGLRGVQEAIASAFAENAPGGVRVRPSELDCGGRALRWVEAGEGGVTPVVLIAGCGTSSLTWLPVLPELSRHGRVVAYDRAGLGASEPERTAVGRATGPSLDGGIEDLAALVRHLGAGPAILVGHSWGGQLAQLLARQRPELVAGLVLVDPAHEDFQPRSIRLAEAALLRLWLLRSAPAATAPGPADPLARAEAAVVGHSHQRRTVLAENRLTNVTTAEIRRRRSATPLPDVPVAVLSATEGLPRAMRSRWTALQSQVASGAPRGTHGTVREAGHAIHADQPGAVVAAVLEVSDRAGYFRKV
ncbi:alpha/beta fold hydrolase [Streptomyces sp. 1331.2]|uniref:alpha/beta fold hydrolase n=1 Tax=Streptomyces sp. 1331.2 TaxID=1938835 RepID=UPI000BD8AB16|nr:alpha/beta hydrolase [Streptomyces sp. 1331.2]SOB80739.1 Pimeloyl-ACP methyl ester carboxylesterase [Streptomyces sp. 1331.2]